MRGDALIDLRNIYNPAEAAAAGFVYTSIGRARVWPAAVTAEAAE